MDSQEYTTLISAASLAACLESESADIVVLDTRFDLADPASGRQQYAQSHLPGARFADLDEDLSGPAGPETGRHPLPAPDALAARFADWGVTPHTQIVAYDAGSGAFAARLWWLARWLGHERVAVLDGGFDAWRAAGLPTAEGVGGAQAPRGEYSADDRQDALWVSTAEVQKALSANEIVLVDARAAERFAGKAEPIDPVAGHVPGAVNLPFPETLRPDGTFRSPGELAERFSAVLGDHSPESMVAMCGSGVTACHLLLGMQHAGLPGGRLYAGSWSEWIRDPARAVEKG
jgi:thiosulfate/3-mercaptopyruvate sulfurtransferase